MIRPAACRLPDWHTRLIAYCQAVEHRAFQYGSSDCFCFANGAVIAMTGHNLFPQFEGAYTNRFGMLRLIRRHGYDSLLSLVSDNLKSVGWPQIDPAEATIGDIAMMPGQPVTSLGICCADGVIAQAVHGLAVVPGQHALATWRVPHAL